MELDKLERLAKAAGTDEPWFPKRPRNERTPRIEYIAALSPETVLALIAAIRCADALTVKMERGPKKEWDAYDRARAAIERGAG